MGRKNMVQKMHVQVTSFLPVLKDPSIMKGITANTLKWKMLNFWWWSLVGEDIVSCFVQLNQVLHFWCTGESPNSELFIYLFILFNPLTSGQTRPQQQQYCLL